MEVSLIVIRQVAVMALLICIGFVATKKQLLTQESARVFSNLLLTLVMPLIMVRAYQQDFTKEKLVGLGLSFLICILFYALTIVLSHLLIRKRTDPNYRIEIIAAIYPNCGFMGIPLLQATLGDLGVFYCAAAIGVFNVLTWTHGITLLTEQKHVRLRNLLNPAMLGLTTGLVLFLTGWRLPGVLADTVNFVANLNTPLAMMITGVFLAEVDLKKALTNLHVYVPIFLRLVVYPLLMLLFLKLLPLSRLFEGASAVAFTMLIASACPTAATTVLLPSKLGYSGTRGAEIVSISTVLSIVTLPLLVMLFTLIPPL